MPIQIFDCEQGSEEWFRTRMGIPTASEFATVLAKGKGAAESKTRRTYMLKLAGEILTGKPMESYNNPYMERGKEMEAEARQLYEFTRDVECQRVGFIKLDDLAGCSPDSLVSDGLLEIKTKVAHLHIDCLLRGEFPPEHKAQCQGQLWITGREWCDLMVYWPALPFFVVRCDRDEAYIKQLETAVRAFSEELAETVDRVRQWGEPIKAQFKQALEAEDGRLSQ